MLGCCFPFPTQSRQDGKGEQPLCSPTFRGMPINVPDPACTTSRVLLLFHRCARASLVYDAFSIRPILFFPSSPSANPFLALPLVVHQLITYSSNTLVTPPRRRRHGRQSLCQLGPQLHHRASSSPLIVPGDTLWPETDYPPPTIPVHSCSHPFVAPLATAISFNISSTRPQNNLDSPHILARHDDASLALISPPLSSPPPPTSRHPSSPKSDFQIIIFLLPLLVVVIHPRYATSRCTQKNVVIARPLTRRHSTWRFQVFQRLERYRWRRFSSPPNKGCGPTTKTD